MSNWVDLHALWQIVVVGLLAGAGLPALFAVGLRALSLRPGGAAVRTRAGDEQVVGGSPVGIAAAGLCFAVVLAAVGYGIYIIVNGG
jgi:hypothetical protein